MKNLKDILSEAFLIKKHQSKQNNRWVDLDLPSGIKWATCNIGADKPEEYGYYYQWGLSTKYNVNEEPKDFLSKDDYTDWIIENYLNSNKHYLDKKIENEILRDMSEGRLPDDNDIQELIDNTEREEIDINNIKCVKFKSIKNPDKYIVIPYGGIYNAKIHVWKRQNISFRLLSTAYDGDDICPIWVTSLNCYGNDVDADSYNGSNAGNWRPVLDKK